MTWLDTALRAALDVPEALCFSLALCTSVLNSFSSYLLHIYHCCRQACSCYFVKCMSKLNLLETFLLRNNEFFTTRMRNQISQMLPAHPECYIWLEWKFQQTRQIIISIYAKHCTEFVWEFGCVWGSVWCRVKLQISCLLSDCCWCMVWYL